MGMTSERHVRHDTIGTCDLVHARNRKGRGELDLNDRPSRINVDDGKRHHGTTTVLFHGVLLSCFPRERMFRNERLEQRDPNASLIHRSR